jgi:hypothetical protein
MQMSNISDVLFLSKREATIPKSRKEGMGKKKRSGPSLQHKATPNVTKQLVCDKVGRAPLQNHHEITN